MLKRLIISLAIISSMLSAVTILLPRTAYAACTDTSRSFLGIPTWYKYLEIDDSCSVVVPKENDRVQIDKVIGPILLAVFEIILRIAGVAAVGFVIFGGIQYILSQGEPERTKGAKSTILNAFIGLAIAISATAIVNLIGKNLL